MTILDIKLMPDEILRKKAKFVNPISNEILHLLDDMAETMYNAPGLGLAANQIGILKRLIVVDCSSNEEDSKLWKMINPEIVSFSDKKEELEEGCLSIPDHKAIVKRPLRISVSYTNIEGGKNSMEATGLLAACIQHEIDHLNGVLFIDHISRLKRDMIIRKVKKQVRENE